MSADDFAATQPPVVLDYGRAKPLGYQAVQKLTRFFPLTALPNTDMIRFIINSQGFWDPYSSYLRFTVTVKTPNGGLPSSGNGAGYACQLDNSAASLIQFLSIIQNGVEIERIDRYEVLASILNDIFYSKEQRMQRTHEGFGIGLPSYVQQPTATTYTTANAASVANITNLGSALSVASMSGYSVPQIDILTMSDPSATAITGIRQSKMTFTSPYFDGSGEPVIWSYSSNTDFATITFCIPIISGIFGVLMPADEIKYIPMQFFPNLEMNLRLNPYAFHNLSSTLSYRNFQINSCELFVNIIHFAPEINASMRRIVEDRGLYLHTCSYYYGPSHMIPANGSFETYPINMSFKSLRSIIWCFMPINYRSKPYVRELRRKALNCTSAQCRIGGDLYPTFPIGNGAGSSGSNLTNSDFVVNTYKAFGRLHDTVNDSLVTSHTFCEGNALGTWTYNDGMNNLTEDMYNMNPTQFYQAIPYARLVTGMPILDTMAYYYQNPPDATHTQGSLLLNSALNNYIINQIVPRATFGIDLDTITSDDSVISGVNTLVNKPFELILEGTNPTADACELNMFLYYDFVVMIDKDYTIKYLGRGG